MLKDLLDKGKCALGYHVEAWQSLPAAPCRQSTRCPRCGAVAEREAHSWDGWHRTDDHSCQASRSCTRCARCETRDDHCFEAWRYIAADSCRQQVTCRRCGLDGSETRLEHDFGEWTASSFYGGEVRVCRRCAEMRFSTADGTDEPVSFQQADRAIAALVGVDSIEELRRRIAAHQGVLYSRAAGHALAFAVDQRASGDDERGMYEQLAVIIGRCRAEGLDAVLGASPSAAADAPEASGEIALPPTREEPSPADGAAARRIAGQWRHTEAMSSGGFSMVTDTHLILDAGGRFAWSSNSSSGALGSSRSAAEEGAWTFDGSALRLRFDGGGSFDRACSVDGNGMLLPDESRYRYWERIG